MYLHKQVWCASLGFFCAEQLKNGWLAAPSSLLELGALGRQLRCTLPRQALVSHRLGVWQVATSCTDPMDVPKCFL